MKATIFVDASAWVASANQGDINHVLAARAYLNLLRDYQRLVTTNLVVAEVYILLRHDLGHDAAVAFLDKVRSSPRIERVISSQELEEEAERILRHYDDQSFSYADAVSFALMKARHIKEAFAFDKHFLTMGFALVPSNARR